MRAVRRIIASGKAGLGENSTTTGNDDDQVVRVGMEDLEGAADSATPSVTEAELLRYEALAEVHAGPLKGVSR